MVARPRLIATGVPRPAPTIRYTGSGTAVVRIGDADFHSLRQLLFTRHPDREWGTFFRFGYRRTKWGLSVSFVDAIPPRPGDLDRSSPITTFAPDYVERAFHAARDGDGLAVGVAHSHPVGCGLGPSRLDDDMDAYFAEELEAYGRGVPYCSLIFSEDDRPGVAFSGRVRDRGNWETAETLVVVGDRVDRWRSRLTATPGGAGRRDVTARLSSVLGEGSAERLAGATVGVVGCSGTGSPAVEVLARAGVGAFVLVDPDRLSPSNLERLHGSGRHHLDAPTPPYKVELLRELIGSINPDAAVTALVGNVLHTNAVDELLRCDLVLGCTDSVHGRVALDEFARRHLVPVLDVGVRMAGGDGRLREQLVGITGYGPARPCAFCRGLVDAIALDAELTPEAERAERRAAAAEAADRGVDGDQYWRDSPRPLHTVGYLTTIAGSLTAGYAEGILTGTFSPPHPDMQFDIGRERFGVAVPPSGFREHCPCRRHRGRGDVAGDSMVNLPRHWPGRAVVLRTGPTDVRTAEPRPTWRNRLSTAVRKAFTVLRGR